VPKSFDNMADSQIHPSPDDLLDDFLPDSFDPSTTDGSVDNSKVKEVHPGKINVVNLGEEDALYDGDEESDPEEPTATEPDNLKQDEREEASLDKHADTHENPELADKDKDSVSTESANLEDRELEPVATTEVVKTTEIGREMESELTKVEVEKKIITTTAYEFEGGETTQVVTYVEDPHSPERCFATGPGLKKAKEKHGTKFKILTIEPGLIESGNLSVRITAEETGVEAEVDVVDNGDSTYLVHYTAPTSGMYNIEVVFYGNHIPGSPFQVPVAMIPDASKCRAYGYAIDPNAVLMAGQPLEFFVDATQAGQSDLIVIVRGSKEDPKAFISDDGNGVFSVKFQILNWGEYYANVWYANKHIPGSPFPLIVHAFPNADKVKVYGPGIAEYVLVNQPAEFHIETKEAGLGTLTIRVQGPKDAFKIDATPISERHHRTLIARYDPTECGEYVITVRWHGQLVPGSPFQIKVFDPDAEVEEESGMLQDRFGYAGSDSEGSDDSISSDEGPVKTKQLHKDLQNVLLTEEEAHVYASILKNKMQVPKNRETDFPLAPQKRKDKRYEGVKDQGTVVVEGSKEFVARSMKVNKPKKKY
jgi:hypothetical protein